MVRIIMLFLLVISKVLMGFQSYSNCQINREVAPMVPKLETIIRNLAKVCLELRGWQIRITYKDSKDLQI